jgi:hypothetical protein
MAQMPRAVPRWSSVALASIPFLAVGAGWLVIPHALEYPRYLLPPIGDVWTRFLQMLSDGSLARHTGRSLLRLAAGFVAGNALAIPLGIAIALRRDVAETVRPVLTFLQSIAGIAWIPLAIVWFGIGNGAVIFVIANIVFFSVIYNTVIGVQTIPLVLRRAVLASGGRGTQILTERERTRVPHHRGGPVVQDRCRAAGHDRHRPPMAPPGPPAVRATRAGHRRTVGHAPAVDHESVPATSRKPSASGLSWEAPAWLDSIPRGWACALRLGSPMRSPCRR